MFRQPQTLPQQPADDTVVGKQYQESQAITRSLSDIGQMLWVTEYRAPQQKEIEVMAQVTGRTLGWDKIMTHARAFTTEKRLLPPDPINEEFPSFFSLGLVFHYANQHLVVLGEPSVRFLRYAIMCFNGGWGSKQWDCRPKPEDWDVCNTEDDPQNGAACVAVGDDVLRKALEKTNEPGLGLEERLKMIPGLDLEYWRR